MTYDYKEEKKYSMSITLENGITVEGEFIELRITASTLPPGKQWYQIRHCDNDWIQPASVKRGCVVVNFMGTFISEPIGCLENPGEELEIMNYRIFDN